MVVLAQQGLREAWYARLFILVLAVLVVSAGMAEFAAGLVLTDTLSTRLSIYGFTSRLALIAIITIYVIQALTRDRLDKQLELLVSLDVPREFYLLGRFLGFVLVLGIIAAMAGVYPIIHVSAATALGWAASLGLEMMLLVALAVFLTISINNMTICFGLAAGFYLLARNMGNLLLLSESNVVQTGDALIDWIRSLLSTINVFMPDLWRFARTDWLLDNRFAMTELGMNCLSGVIFTALLLMAAAFDLHRKNL